MNKIWTLPGRKRARAETFSMQLHLVSVFLLKDWSTKSYALRLAIPQGVIDFFLYVQIFSKFWFLLAIASCNVFTHSCDFSDTNMNFVVSCLDLDFLFASVYSLQYNLFFVVESFYIQMSDFRAIIDLLPFVNFHIFILSGPFLL
jgi:hypothetical protein